MARLPQPGGDNGNWGTILNDFLSRALKPDGLLKDNAVTSNTIAPNAVTNAAIASNAVNATSIADGSITNVLISDATIEEAKLSSAVQTKLNNSGANKVVGPGTATDNAIARYDGTTGKLIQDSGVVIDDSGRMGIGTTSPATAIHISGATYASTQIQSYAITDNADSVLSLRRARAGTSAVQIGDGLGSLAWRGHDGTSYGSDAALISVQAINNFTTTDHRTRMSFSVTPDGSPNLITPMALYGDHLDLTYDIPSPVNVQSGLYSTISGKGDNATYTGVTAGSFVAKDRTDVDTTNKGVLNAVVASVVPLVTRNNVPFDDVNGLMISNDGTARATDALYVAHNSNITGSEWSTTFTSDANADFGIRMMGNYAVQMLNLKDKFVVDANGKVGINTTSPTHSITLSSTSTGTAAYNTVDQTTDYERVRQYWSGNAFNIVSEAGGTGTIRTLSLGNNGNSISIMSGSTKTMINASSGSSSAVALLVSGVLNGASGNQQGLRVANTINQTGTAGYTAFTVSPTETATGSGTKLLADFQVGGVSKTRIDTAGSHVLSSGANYISYGTSDETINYERVRQYWNGNVYTITAENGGTGTLRSITVNGAASFITLAAGGIAMGRGSTVNSNIITQSATLAASTGVQNLLNINPTINQSSTAGYTALVVNPTETATGSGSKLLADFQVSGVSKAKIDTAGIITATAGTSAGNVVTIDGAQILTNKTLTSPVINGTPTGTGFTSSATASSVASRDANANLLADAFIPGFTSTATAASTTTLTVDSTEIQVFTGTQTQTCQLPTTGVVAGQRYTVIDNSSGVITVNASGGSAVQLIPGSHSATFVALQASPTLPAHWQIEFHPSVGVSSTGGAGNIALRDGNANLRADAFVPSLTSTPTAAGTTTMSVDSNEVQIFTGSSIQTVLLPTTSIVAGQRYTMVNQSTGNVTVQSSAGNTVYTLGVNNAVTFIALQAAPTAATHWIYLNHPNVSFSTGTAGSSIAQRTSNGLLNATAFVPNLTSIATVAGTTTMTAGDSETLVLTGTTTQTVLLPTTSIVAGQRYTIINTSTGLITINASGGTLVATLASGQNTIVQALQAAPTTTAHWSVVNGGVGRPKFTEYTNSSTSTDFTATSVAKPTGAIGARITIIPGGAGGGSGRRGAAGTYRGGGAGGANQLVPRDVTVDLPGASYSVLLGKVGAGGAAVTTDNTDGNIGVAMNPCTFTCGTAFVGTSSTVLTAGLGGTSTVAATSGSPVIRDVNTSPVGLFLSGGAGGGTSTGLGVDGMDSWTPNFPSGAGGGGSITSANVVGNGGAGGRNRAHSSPALVAGGIVDTTPPPAPAAGATAIPGQGGGGGAASITTAAQAGADAVGYGAPGGGGGASLNGNNSGRGGNGGPAYMRIEWIYS